METRTATGYESRDTEIIANLHAEVEKLRSEKVLMEGYFAAGGLRPDLEAKIYELQKEIDMWKKAHAKISDLHLAFSARARKAESERDHFRDQMDQMSEARTFGYPSSPSHGDLDALVERKVREALLRVMPTGRATIGKENRARYREGVHAAAEYLRKRNIDIFYRPGEDGLEGAPSLDVLHALADEIEALP